MEPNSKLSSIHLGNFGFTNTAIFVFVYGISSCCSDYFRILLGAETKQLDTIDTIDSLYNSVNII